MNKISCIITGASGFVGKNLMAYLSGDFIELIPVSVRNPIDKSIFASCNTIVHLAGKAHDTSGTSEHDLQSYDEINYEITKKVFDIFITSNTKKFIFISSIKAVTDSPEGIITEDLFPNPKTAYGISKLKAEKYLLSFSLPNDKKVYILRPSMIHGPNNKGNLNQLYKFIKIGIPYPLAAFENKRTFLSIGNFCFIIKQLLIRNDIPSGIYNVADEKSISTNRLIELISSILEKNIIKLAINKKLIIGLAKIGDYMFFTLSSERIKKMVSDYEVSNRKLIDTLGVSLPVEAEEGIIKTLLSFKEKKNKIWLVL
jgi:nucleoside-diphosphate-sugar epimerase